MEHESQHLTEEQQRWEPDMAPVKKPIWPPVLGGICIALGALGFVCGGLGMLMIPFSASMVENILEGDPPPPSMSPSAYTMVLGVLGVLLSGWLLVAAIMLVMRRYASKMLFLIYACLSLPLSFVSFFNQLSIQAADKQWAQDYAHNPMAAGMNSPGTQAGQMVGLVIFLALGLGWPLFILIWFGLVKTKEHQFTGIDPDEDY
jgi:hypothetical protein